ncbi:ribosome-associated translation inhibitor RaiA [Kocuria palustris]|jgi:ribosomal subunit interface protein|uniref:ribosome hibernation-promoting factor, HPF/YfiA family n=1 Tax=Kocuria palustris TaxID=71999 RepID=UPI0019D3140C|nr:ribosome-associated translation inhibitor RaiA [Kocuria palustris]MBN6752078.1 ribosome-associated translation inhibitor RaiA [Kocuria palustris]MBN6757033.1 ribosome-associated translation inhibitor RaiA [Kocuria palustris]MBN6762061.1 ribosome-associated translation inhibitor RaiA [Kocuria palustris]MBN6781543.1 ribosome-associated translation inhibitor RaiA [Kocuria palustris]MBN6798027.1 ribosome-associated translation inhibitor RaiA [Kocuria palustris]
MELTIQGRNVTISDRFRDYVETKVARFEELGDKVQRIEIKVLKENPQPGHDGMRVEATVIGRGPVVRAEARGDDKQAAFDSAYAKLIEQLRRARDRRKIHRGNHRPTAVHEATAALPVLPISDRPYASPEELSAAESEAFDTEYALSEDVPPVEIRRKSFPAERMSADQAIDRMELVGHDFFLYIDSATDEPSVAYRRKGWEYGVISLSDSVAEPETVEERAYQAS